MYSTLLVHGEMLHSFNHQKIPASHKMTRPRGENHNFTGLSLQIDTHQLLSLNSKEPARLNLSKRMDSFQQSLFPTFPRLASSLPLVTEGGDTRNSPRWDYSRKNKKHSDEMFSCSAATELMVSTPGQRRLYIAELCTVVLPLTLYLPTSLLEGGRSLPGWTPSLRSCVTECEDRRGEGEREREGTETAGSIRLPHLDPPTLDRCALCPTSPSGN